MANADNDSMEHLPERTGREPLAAAERGSALPDVYLPFAETLPPAMTEAVSPLDALGEDPEIAGYLKHPASGKKSDCRKRALLGFVLCAGALFCAYWLPGWRLLERYVPPPVRETPKPREYAGDIPLRFRDEVLDINADIAAGDRLRTVFAKLRRFDETSRNAAPPPPREMSLWANTELLVALASKDLPPRIGAGGVADRTYDSVVALCGTAPELPVPFRASTAYAEILHARLAGNAADAGGDGERLAGVLEEMRDAHSAAMDGNATVLAIEADAHIMAFPATYAEGDDALDYHWRRASHALGRLHAVLGADNPVTRGLEAKRWKAVHAYFDVTLLTLDWNRFWRLEKVTLDGRDYTRDEVEKILAAL